MCPSSLLRKWTSWMSRNPLSYIRYRFRYRLRVRQRLPKLAGQRPLLARVHQGRPPGYRREPRSRVRLFSWRVRADRPQAHTPHRCGLVFPVPDHCTIAVGVVAVVRHVATNIRDGDVHVALAVHLDFLGRNRLDILAVESARIARAYPRTPWSRESPQHVGQAQPQAWRRVKAPGHNRPELLL